MLPDTAVRQNPDIQTRPRGALKSPGLSLSSAPELRWLGDLSEVPGPFHGSYCVPKLGSAVSECYKERHLLSKLKICREEDSE